ncbi:hypothetical protein Tco_1071045 [Tanacetum coccineum]|uniref:Uncharacterized protein n=1 Tax=Tanacetum coccineum TaxID=301880 RepID=A0ABQ5HN57_9ASTR
MYSNTMVLENSAKHNFLENLKKKMFPTPANLPYEMSKRARNTRGQASSSREKTMEEKVHKSFSPTKVFLSRSSTPSTPIPSPDHNGYEPLHKGVTFMLRGVERGMSLLELGWRVGLYSERESKDAATLSLIWGTQKQKSFRDPRIKLADRCITMTITGRKETTNRVTEIDLFYLYCILKEGVVCNIPYWLTKYLKGIKDKSVIFRGIFVTKIARSFGLLTEEMRNKGDDEEGDGEGGNEGAGGSTDIYHNMSTRD